MFLMITYNNNEKQQLISENACLFWWIPAEKKKQLSDESLVETILNYGDMNGVKKLIQIYGIKKVSDIFFKQIENKRNNYLPQTIYYFSLYFKKHAH
jgi:hypothetical protein